MSGSGGVSVKAGPSPRLNRASRSALRRAVRRVARKMDQGGPESGERPPASWICATCGQLAWPEAADPHRAEPGRPPTVSAACSHCGDRAWIDLGDASTALVLSERDQHPRRSFALNLALYAFGGFVIATVLAFAGFAFDAIAWMGPLGAALGVVGALRSQRAGVEAPSSLPVRWSMSLPPAEDPPEELVGPIEGADDGLLAPLSGRRCLAYEVAVRDDARADAPPPTWSLVEQRVAPFALAGRSFDGASVHLRLEREHLGLASKLDLSPAALAFLRLRGLDPEVDFLHVFESVIEGGEGVVLRHGPKGAELARRRALAAAEPGPGPTST
ncbi:MAG: hypothetical protein H6711_19185 [Myxococcales bacterium]|nr:hypothetical protein [Myxococcales bacterium]